MFNVSVNNNEMIIDKELNELLEGLKIDYTQFYRGIVVDNIDPELKGRIKVRIPQIYGTDPESNVFISTDSIPWACCAILPAGNDSGSFLPPNIGDTVFVTFESGRPTSPIYFGGILTTRVEDEEPDKKGIGSTKIFGGRIAPVNVDDLPQEVITGTERIIYKSLKGAVIYIDDKDENECIKIVDQNGQSIIMENLSASMLGRRGGDVGKNPRSQIVLTNSSGDSITLTQGKIHLKSSNIIFETDNFLQIGLNELDDEINVADIILGKEEAIITLNFIDMRTGESLSGTVSEVYLKTGSSESLLGTYQTRSNTFLELNLSTGDYRVHTTLDGYYESDIDISVDGEEPQTMNVYMSKETTEDNVQIVLTWNDVIPDMDSHTKIYNQNGNLLGHVSFRDKNYYQDDMLVVNLDVDDTNYQGPETTTINKTYNNKYLFYVHRWSGGFDITASSCNVKVYDKGRLLQDINMPTGTYTEDYTYWNVLTYDFLTNRITINNTITTTEPAL